MKQSLEQVIKQFRRCNHSQLTRSSVRFLKVLKSKIYLCIIIKSKNKMDHYFEEPFIIIKSYPEQSYDHLQAEIKERKPTIYTWTKTQNQLYLDFLKKNIQVLLCKKERKRVKIFRSMAEIIKTRSSICIKSHHQKMERKYKTIKTIIFCLQKMLTQSKGQPSTSEVETMTNIHQQMSPNLSEVSDSSQNSPLLRPLTNGSQEQELFFEDESQSIQRIRVDIGYDANQPWF